MAETGFLSGNGTFSDQTAFLRDVGPRKVPGPLAMTLLDTLLGAVGTGGEAVTATEMGTMISWRPDTWAGNTTSKGAGTGQGDNLHS